MLGKCCLFLALLAVARSGGVMDMRPDQTQAGVQICIRITGGESQDYIFPPAQKDQVLGFFPGSCVGMCFECDGNPTGHKDHLQQYVLGSQTADKYLDISMPYDSVPDTQWACIIADATTFDKPAWIKAAFVDSNVSNIHHAVTYGLYPGSSAEEINCCQYRADNSLPNADVYCENPATPADADCCYPCNENPGSQPSARRYRSPDGMIGATQGGGDLAGDCFDVAFIRGRVPLQSQLTMVLGWQRGNHDLIVSQLDTHGQTAGIPIGSQEGFKYLLFQAHYAMAADKSNVALTGCGFNYADSVNCPTNGGDYLGHTVPPPANGDCPTCYHGAYTMTDNSQVLIYYTEEKPEVNMGYLFTGLYPSSWLYLPQERDVFTIQNELTYQSKGCSPSFDQGQTFLDGKSLFDGLTARLGTQIDTIYMASSALHFHTHTLTAEAFIRRNGVLTQFDEYSNKDLYAHSGGSPAYHPLTTAVEYRRGDDYVSRFHFTTKCDDDTVFGGISTNAEMALKYDLYWPAPESHSTLFGVSPCETCFDVNRTTGACQASAAFTCYDAEAEWGVPCAPTDLPCLSTSASSQRYYELTDFNHGFTPFGGQATPDTGAPIFRYLPPYPYGIQGGCPASCWGSVIPAGNTFTDPGGFATGPPPLDYFNNGAGTNLTYELSKPCSNENKPQYDSSGFQDVNCPV